jgi:hypothetical protein
MLEPIDDVHNPWHNPVLDDQTSQLHPFEGRDKGLFSPRLDLPPHLSENGPPSAAPIEDPGPTLRGDIPLDIGGGRNSNEIHERSK